MDTALRVIVAGSRGVKDKEFVHSTLNRLLGQYTAKGLHIVCGMCRGPDMFGWEWAFKALVPRLEFPAEWGTYGKSAGMRRNREMALVSDGAIIFWDGYSSGTKNMYDEMLRLGKPVVLITATLEDGKVVAHEQTGTLTFETTQTSEPLPRPRFLS